MSKAAFVDFELALPFERVSVGPRWLVVHLPAFRLERCGHTADSVVALIAERRNATRLIALTPAARAAGLTEDMTASAARATVAGVLLEALDEVGEAADRQELVRAFDVLCDRVTTWGDGDLLLEIATTAAYFGGEAQMIAKVRDRAAELGHTCRVAVSDHPRASAALARYGGQDTLVPPGGSAAALAGLPLAALEPSDTLAESWTALGLRTVAQWAQLDAASVAGRFGDEGLELHRVARGAAGPSWVQRPAPPPLDGVVVALDDERSDLAGIRAALTDGLLRMRDQLASRDLVAVMVELKLELSWGPTVQVRLRLSRPSRDPALLARMLGERLERITLEAPVTGLRLRTCEVAPETGGQTDLLDRRTATEGWDELLARLGDVLGEQAVFHAATVEAWRPEAAWSALHGTDPAPSMVDPAADDPVERQERATWHTARPRPTLLRHPPLPLHVRLDDERPIAVRSRDGWRPVRRALGPELLEGDWWREDGGFARAYWVVAMPEGTAWVFCEKEQWFLHGWFD